jgi:hypothetical protein
MILVILNNLSRRRPSWRKRLEKSLTISPK